MVRLILILLLLPVIGLSQDVKNEVILSDSTIQLKTTIVNQRPVTVEQIDAAIQQLDKEIIKTQQVLTNLQREKDETLKILGMIEQKKREKKE